TLISLPSHPTIGFLKSMAKNGVGNLLNDPLNVSILAATTAVAWLFAIELNITVFLIFQRKTGLYFWSLMIASWGLTIHALGCVLKFFVGSSWLTTVPIITLGWMAMVTGQAFVLYSRLHLVVLDPKTLHYVFYLIIFNIFALHIPTVVFTYGANSPNNTDLWTARFNVMERIQLAGFCIQETLISGIYVFATIRMLRLIHHSSARKIMIQLILINFCCIGMDIVLICLEYTNQYVGEASIKSMIYAIKLKLEFAVLNQVIEKAIGFTERNRCRGGPSHKLQASCPLPHHVTPTAVKDKPLDSRPHGTPSSPKHIFKTLDINVERQSFPSASGSVLGSSCDFGLGRSDPNYPLQGSTPCEKKPENPV
ncbi:hypothetical protein MMC31_001487, partial [Peltigera leucophlebia]|nr:hypothetical protein [Peltigera leucophlebia]